MRYEFTLEQTAVTPIVVVADSVEEAWEIFQSQGVLAEEDIGDPVWEAPRVRSVKELGE